MDKWNIQVTYFIIGICSSSQRVAKGVGVTITHYAEFPIKFRITEFLYQPITRHVTLSVTVCGNFFSFCFFSAGLHLYIRIRK